MIEIVVCSNKFQAQQSCKGSYPNIIFAHISWGIKRIIFENWV